MLFRRLDKDRKEIGVNSPAVPLVPERGLDHLARPPVPEHAVAAVLVSAPQPGQGSLSVFIDQLGAKSSVLGQGTHNLVSVFQNLRSAYDRRYHNAGGASAPPAIHVMIGQCRTHLIYDAFQFIGPQRGEA